LYKNESFTLTPIPCSKASAQKGDFVERNDAGNKHNTMDKVRRIFFTSITLSRHCSTQLLEFMEEPNIKCSKRTLL
jgi:hypothetical protein